MGKYFVLSFIVAFVFLATAAYFTKDTLLAGFFQTIQNTINRPIKNSETAQSQTLLAQTTRADSSYLNDITFVGDSRTNGMLQYHFVTQDQTYAIDGINHRDIQQKSFIEIGGRTYTLADAISLKEPRIIMVSLGINGVAFMTEEEFMSEYKSLIEMLKYHSPNSQIIIQSMFPVSRQKERNDPRMSNEIIDSYNDSLLQLAKDEGCFFLDSADELKDDNNALASVYDSGDGLHLNEAAYEVIFDYILTHKLIVQNS